MSGVVLIHGVILPCFSPFGNFSRRGGEGTWKTLRVAEGRVNRMRREKSLQRVDKLRIHATHAQRKTKEGIMDSLFSFFAGDSSPAPPFR